MKALSLAQVEQFCGGCLYGEANAPDQMITGVSTDTREDLRGKLFVPLKGDVYDGHDYLENAIKKGAACALWEREWEGLPGIPLIRVDSTYRALRDLAEHYVSQFEVKRLAVTGSVGKTTTKDMIAAVLSEKYRVLKTEGNLNNEIGLPLTVFGLSEEHEAAVLEMGMNHFGEIRNLSKVARPDAAVITNIGEAHIENLGSREGILQAKMEVLAYMPADGTLILNGDDEMLRTLAETRDNILYYGMSEGCRFRADEIKAEGLDGVTCRIAWDDTKITVKIPLPGRHMVYAALAAAAVGATYGLAEQEIKRGIEGFTPSRNRMDIREVNGLTVINDVYNANPTSVKAAVDVLSAAKGRRVCVLGDMLELGSVAEERHREIGRFAANKRIELIVCIGPLSRHMYEAARESLPQGCEAVYFPDISTFLTQGLKRLAEGDTVLVKASRGMHFEKIVEKLSEVREVKEWSTH